MGTPEDRRIRALRPAKPAHLPFRVPTVAVDMERRGSRTERTLTVFLTGAECPFTCVYCDLWQHTLAGATPAGALPFQLERALDLAADRGPFDRVKLYNAGSWFDARAVPPPDLHALARLLDVCPSVTVESHARMVGPRTGDFRDRLKGRLEVAMGLETVHPDALARLNKRMTLAEFDRAAWWLKDHDCDLRVFVLIGAPFVPVGEMVDWVVRSAEYAASRGAAMVSLVPVRPGGGELSRLAARGEFVPPLVGQVEEALERCLTAGLDMVSVDLWDAESIGGCGVCLAQRVMRLSRMNLTGKWVGPVRCPGCDPRIRAAAAG